MASALATETIASRVAQVLTTFEETIASNAQVEAGDSQLVAVQAIGDQFSRFKLWAGNIGAHRTGRSSLGYRLRDSSHLYIQVMRLLDDLITSLGEAHSILSGETLPWDQDPGEADEFDEELKDLVRNEQFEFNSEIGQLTKEVTDTIGHLLRLSMSLRNPAPHDRFMSNDYAKAHYFEAHDKAHVEAKFPRTSQTLVMRLGQALSQRRQYFRCRESHHEKLARGLFDSGLSGAGAQSTVASSIPNAMRVAGSVPVFGELDEDERSDTGFSQTSFATTAPDSDRLTIPPLPKRAYDGPFECPFCFMLVSVSDTHQWKKHVLRDLRPYICLAEDCNTASEEYSRRHEWMNHMSQKHWKSWTCPYQCGLKSTSETGFRQHITRVHGMKSEMELDAINARCGRHLPISPSSPVDCPLCPDTLESIQQYQRHVGRHQVDLALFALPKIEDDGEELDEPNEDQATISTQSGSGSEVMGAVSLIELAEPFDGGPTVEVSKGLPEMQPSQGNKAEGRDGEWFDRSNDVGIELKNEDSRGEPTPSQLAASLGEQELEHQHQEEAAWKKELEKEAKLKAEIEAQKKADHKEVAADATKTAENTKNKADEVFKQQALEKDDARPERSESLEKAKDTVNRYEEQEEAGEAEARRLLKIYKNREAENALKEREEAEERDRQYKQRLQEHLLKSGLDEKEINAIIAGMKIEKPKPEEKEKEHPPLPLQPLPQIGCEERPWPTHTRMARRHLSLETLRIYDVDYIIDQDPEYVLIKRWVPEPEQDIFWSHTRALRNGS